MEIVKITQQNFHAFQEILPPQKQYQPVQLLGCVADKTAVGSAVVYITEDGCSLSWLWVAPEYQRQGIGGALLDKTCEIAAVSGIPGGKLTVTYPEDAPWGTVLEYMLWKRGFSVLVHTYPQYSLTRGQLLGAPFMAHTHSEKISGIVPLSRLSKLQLRELTVENRRLENYSISHADFERADEARSMVLLRNGKVEGLLLVSTMEAEDILSLDLLYLSKSAVHGALALVRQTALAALKHPAGLREVRFICTEGAGMRLCSSLMGVQESIPVRYCNAVLYTGVYRRREEGHVV